ncbi:MAG: patatin family protein [Halarsenatibacteraceae bacterium]
MKEGITIITDTGLVIEGGGMRGAFTAGVLDFFLEKDIKLPYVIGVSAGANNGANFVAEQSERSKRIFIKHSQDKRYMGINRVVKERSYIGMKFLFQDLPYEIDPFDFESFANSKTEFKVVATECRTGMPVYFSHKDYDPEFFIKKILRASSSLPLLCPPVYIDGKSYLDGGISDAIPIRKAVKDGYKKNILILTKIKGHKPKPSKLKKIVKLRYRKYPNLVEIIRRRHIRYNETLNYIQELENKGAAFVLRPKTEIDIKVLENDPDQMQDLYQRGYQLAAEKFEDLKSWIKNVDIKTSNF